MSDRSRLLGEESPGPGLMSLTITVPAAVPSDFQSSSLCVPSFALKYSSPLTLVRPEGFELPEPGLMSLTITVPAAVPSDFQSS